MYFPLSFFNLSSTTHIYTLSLHDALPIYFFFVTGQVYVDQKAPPALRAVAQGLIYFITYGIGMFVGSWICGGIVDRYAKSDRKSTRLNSSHPSISYAVFCLKKKKK